MRTRFLVPLATLLVCTAPLLAQESDVRVRLCKAHGESLLQNAYFLDTCLQRKAMKSDAVNKVRDQLFATYPKLQAEVATKSPMAVNARQAATSRLAYDLNDSRNAGLLAESCKTKADFLQEVSSKSEWKTSLACWR